MSRQKWEIMLTRKFSYVVEGNLDQTREIFETVQEDRMREWAEEWEIIDADPAAVPDEVCEFEAPPPTEDSLNQLDLPFVAFMSVTDE